MIEEGTELPTRTFVLFGTKTRHIINFSDRALLMAKICDTVKEHVVNAIHCELPILALIQHRLIETFPSTTFRYAKNLVVDITNKDEQREIVVTEHNRAHRAAQENTKQILEDYFFPKMTQLANEVVINCKVCKKAKYDRHPQKQVIGATPIPSYVGEILHIDIFSTDKKYFLTCADKLSKFAIVQPIDSRTIIDVESPILQLMNFFPRTKVIFCDNEPSLNSETIRSILSNNFGVEIVNAPPLHSTSNGQVERLHSTILEIARCLKLEKSISDTVQLILLATIEYNRTIHTVTNKRPIDVIHSDSLELEVDVRNIVQKAQES